MTPTEGATLHVDLAAIAANWRSLAARHAGQTAGVVKADAYGLGAIRVAPALLDAGCRHFFVAHLGEALAIRPLLPGAMLAVLNGLLPGTEAVYAAHDILPVLSSLDELARWSRHAMQLQRHLPALLHVDTGMNRLGLDPLELARLQAEPALLNGVELRFVMTHLASAEVHEDPLNQVQRERFAEACAGLPSVPRSLANSAGMFLGPEWGSDLARPGAALYGLNPTPGHPNPMLPTVRLRARILQIRDVKHGEAVGYNSAWRAERASRIATACIGYADGWPRSLSTRGMALFDGAPVPLVGRVSMDLTTFDVTEQPRAAAGDWLDLLAPDLSPDVVAETAGTNGYEILTSLGRRYHRVYAS